MYPITDPITLFVVILFFVVSFVVLLRFSTKTVDEIRRSFSQAAPETRPALIAAMILAVVAVVVLRFYARA